MGFIFALGSILSGEGGSFVIFWLAAWTVGGVFAALTIKRVFQKSIPAELILETSEFRYDTGLEPFEFKSGMKSQSEFWKTIVAKRKKYNLNDVAIKTIRLRDTDSGNRLTVDIDNERIDIAKGSTEIEKEWIFSILQEKYLSNSL